MASVRLERVCPYCASNKLTFLEHGSEGTLFQCELCARAAIQRWEPDTKTVSRTPPEERSVRPRSTEPGKPGKPK
jgi:hypothetical protein